MKVALLDDYIGVALDSADWSKVRARAEIVVFDRPLAVPDEAAAALADFDIICTLRERMPITAELIAKLPKLKYIVVTGKRYDTIDAKAAASRGIPVTTTRAGGGSGPGAVVELTWGLIFAVTRQIVREDASVRSGGWQTALGTSLGGKTLGVVGLGSLGTSTATIGRAFGMDVVAWSPNLTDERARAAGVRRVDKHELFASSDVVSLHLVLSETTRGVVGRAELGAMKPTAFLINTSRGELVDEIALIDVLSSGKIGGAGLDVYAIEPLPKDHPIRKLPNTVLTPHVGYFHREQMQKFYGEASLAILGFLEGRPVPSVNLPA